MTLTNSTLTFSRISRILRPGDQPAELLEERFLEQEFAARSAPRSHTLRHTRRKEDQYCLIQTCFRAFMVSHSLAASWPRLFILYQVVGVAATFYTWGGAVISNEFVVTGRQCPSRTALRFQFGIWTTRFRRPIGNTLAAEAAVGRKAGSK